VFGTFYEYVIRWMLPLVALWVATASWSIVTTLRERRAGRNRFWWSAVAVLLVSFSTVGVVRAAQAEVPSRRDVDITAALSAQASRQLDPTRRYQLNEVDPVSLGSVAFGLALEFERHGQRVGVGPWGAAGVMPFRVVADAQADARLWYVASAPLLDAFMKAPGARLVARVDIRTPAEVARSNQLERTIITKLCAAGGESLAEVLYSRWGFIHLVFGYDIPADVKPMLDELGAIHQPAGLVELPMEVDGYALPVYPTPLCVT
jgi:hypothetical protein